MSISAKRLFLKIVLSLLITSASASDGGQFSNMIVFGDSLSDMGNNTWVNATGSPITSFDGEGNKYTWPNYLSKKLFDSKVACSSCEAISPLTNSVIYAYASADSSANYLGADWPNVIPQPVINAACAKPGLFKNDQGNVKNACVPGLLKQIDLYLNDVHSVPKKTTMFFIWSGANDLFYKLPTGESPEKIVKTVAMNVLQAKNKLLDHGVSPKQIYVLNLPDLSLTPYAISHGLKLTQISTLLNTTLASLLTEPSDPSHPGLPSAHIISIFDLLNDVVKNAEKYNLKNVTDSCEEKGGIPLCKGFLFFDMKHPTASIHRAISDYILMILHKGG